ncbi:MAG: hypothetical protein ACREXT_12140, partial [Gammaproteobacteria bacterium]
MVDGKIHFQGVGRCESKVSADVYVAFVVDVVAPVEAIVEIAARFAIACPHLCRENVRDDRATDRPRYAIIAVRPYLAAHEALEIVTRLARHIV